MNKLWDVEVNGTMHEVFVKAGMWSSKVKLIVDSEETIIKKSWKADFTGLDIPFYIEDKECHIVISGNIPDLAVDGIYVDSQTPYAPLKPMPKWGWIFVVLCLAIPVLASGGAIPIVIGILGASSCAKTACAVRGTTIAKVINCIFVTVFCWIIWLGLVMMLISAQG